jgi:superfamily II DNA or RNA helicase
LTEGTDLPRTDCILLARPTCNASLYIQMIGRGLRTHPDKTDCLVLDVIDKMKSPKRSLITFPTLLALQEASKSNRDPSVDQSEIKKRKDRRIGEINFEVVTVKINKSKITAINLENERLAWVNIPDYPIHVLECPEFRIVLMEEENNFQNCLYTAVVTSRKLEEEEGFNGFERSASHSYKLTIGTSLGIREILNEIDNYISDFERKTHKSLTQNLSRTAFWRRSYPPSTKQQSILFKAAKKYNANDVDIRAIFKVSKGQAANSISRINFLKVIKCPIQHSWADIFN